jgi:putative ABC transport system permease protein
MEPDSGPDPEKSMKKERDTIRPPRWAERFLTWYCRPELLEDLQGDLLEYFERNKKQFGIRRAKLRYVADVIKFFRGYTLRKPQLLETLTHWIMLSSYVKTSGRSIIRNKLFSVINVIGLSISMSVGLILIAMLSDLRSFDQFHQHKDRLYRVLSRSTFLQQSPEDYASTSILAGRKIREEVPGIETLTIFRNSFGGDATVGTKAVPVSGLWADENFFKVFTFPLVAGNSGTALKDPFTVVLTEKTAKKIFGDEEALGKTIHFDTLDYVVTGVMKDIPEFSHLNFELLASLSSADKLNQKESSYLTWESMWSNYVYFVKDKNASLKTIEENLRRISDRENKTIQNRKIGLSLQPLSAIAISPSLSNQPGRTMPESILWIITALALIVILSACFNYTNLSLARAFRRTREVGIRKVIGAMKSHVLTQFVVEAVIISLLALAVAVLLFFLVRPYVLGLSPEIDQMVNLELSFPVIGWFVVCATAIGVVAGFLPALFFARLNASRVLKDASSVKVFGQVTLRRALIVAQYTLSLIFITTTIIGYHQYKGFLAIDLGFSTANILNIRLEGNDSELLKKGLSEMPEVQDISKSSLVTNIGSYYGDYLKYEKSNDSSLVWYNAIDERYLPLHEHQLLAGRNFTSNSKDEIIVNEEALRRFGQAGRKPAEVLGAYLSSSRGKFLIVGVVKDFLYGKAENNLEPVVFRYITRKEGYLNVKVSTSDWPETLSKIENVWRKIDTVHPLVARFYTDQIEEAYREYSALLQMLGFLAVLAVCISSMGLFGMVVFTTETRMKEVSIRKVLGATEGKLIFLLSRGFLVLLCVSALIALPATYLFFDRVILVRFQHHQPISPVEMLAGFTGVMLLAVIMIGSQTFRVARANPAEVLKSE